jgi:tRNA modification GTPase
MNTLQEDTIVALSTPPGQGALALIRLSGPNALQIAAAACAGSNIAQQPTHTVRLVRIQKENRLIDEAVLTLFRAPASFTREDVAEFACHGSPYIIRSVMEYLIQLGARPAGPGEFTLRAYLNGAMDLAQAEAVADLIASESEMAHTLAMHQMRGGFSDILKQLRAQMLDFVSLIELELDFGEEDVEFADRSALKAAIEKLKFEIQTLADSFSIGNVIRNGIPTAIIGKPNAGKSTLLNALLNDARAIVSDIAGTTRDIVEDRLFLQGAEFRLMDTAGIRTTEDSIEKEGIARSLSAAEKARVVLYVFDINQESEAEAEAWCSEHLNLQAGAKLIYLANKADRLSQWPVSSEEVVYISAQHRTGLDLLSEHMIAAAGIGNTPTQYVTHARHYQALNETLNYLTAVEEGMSLHISTDLLAEDLRAAMYALGSITGEISNDEVLGNIFGKFCIGK